jgi:hypothetical protein
MFSTLIIVLPIFALAGFLLIEFGAVNLVPVLFSLAVAAPPTTGFAGILAGPTWAVPRPISRSTKSIPGVVDTVTAGLESRVCAFSITPAAPSPGDGTKHKGEQDV